MHLTTAVTRILRINFSLFCFAFLAFSTVPLLMVFFSQFYKDTVPHCFKHQTSNTQRHKEVPEERKIDPKHHLFIITCQNEHVSTHACTLKGSHLSVSIKQRIIRQSVTNPISTCCPEPLINAQHGETQSTLSNRQQKPHK